MQHIYGMAQDEASEASVASSSPAACWWETITATTNSSSILMSSSSSAACSWNAPASINNHGRRNWKLPPSDQQLAASNSCNIDDDDEAPADISISTNSFTNPSIPAGSSDHSENHLWNQLLMGSVVGNSQGMQQISSQKNFIRSALMFDDPACDYLKKLDSGNWELTTDNCSADLSTSLEKQLIRGVYDDGGEEGDHNSDSRLIISRSNLTDLVSNWSIAPPNIYHHQHLHKNNNNIGHTDPIMINNPNSGIAASSDHHLPSPQYIKHEAFHSIYADHDHDHVQLLDHALQQNDNGRLLIGPVIGLKNRGLMEEDAPSSSSSWSNIINSFVPRNNLSAADLISFTPSLLTMNKQQPAALMELRGSSCRHGNNKIRAAGHHHQPASSSSYSYRKGGGRRDSSGTAPSPCEGKKKITTSHDHCTPPFKKPKHHHTSTTTSSQSLQAPKVKVGDKITAIQQLVSPFGKTDTASVLLETIKYIRFLQEQVQLLSDPYLKPNANKDHMSSWTGSMERKEKAEPKQDLRGRGLCLVPISCTPQAYRENTGPDFWTPPFRGCLYR